MYNEDTKLRFIDYYTESPSTAETCKTIFNAFQSYEAEWGADLCTRSAQELKPVVEKVVGLRNSSKSYPLVILRDYVRWCVRIGVQNACDGMLDVKIDGIEKTRKQMVANPLGLQIYLDSVFDSEEEQTTDNIYRAFYWLAYSGMDEADIITVKSNDVDFQNLMVRCNDAVFPIYREAIPSLRNCVELTQFLFKNANYLDKSTWLDRAEGNTIIRGVRSATTLDSLKVSLSRKSAKMISEGKTSLKLSYGRVWLSGLFYRMYEMEKAGRAVDFTGVAKHYMQGKTYDLSSGRNRIEAVMRRIAKNYLNDYNQWKLAFCL